MDRKLVLNILKEIGKDIFGIFLPISIILVVVYIVFTLAYLLVFFTGGNTPEISVWFLVPGILALTSIVLAGLCEWFYFVKLRAERRTNQEENTDA